MQSSGIFKRYDDYDTKNDCTWRQKEMLSKLIDEWYNEILNLGEKINCDDLLGKSRSKGFDDSDYALISVPAPSFSFCVH